MNKKSMWTISFCWLVQWVYMRFVVGSRFKNPTLHGVVKWRLLCWLVRPSMISWQENDPSRLLENLPHLDTNRPVVLYIMYTSILDILEPTKKNPLKKKFHAVFCVLQKKGQHSIGFHNVQRHTTTYNGKLATLGEAGPKKPVICTVITITSLIRNYIIPFINFIY